MAERLIRGKWVSMYTSGPWWIEPYTSNSLVIHYSEDNRICFMATAGDLGNANEIVANAHLIAAAPDLLEALKDLLEWADEYTRTNKCPTYDVPYKARGAINKANGAAVNPPKVRHPHVHHL